MSGGMGEGWSDFYARSLLSTADESVNGLYTIGGWATKQIDGPAYLDNYYYGIRRFPYAPRAVTGLNGRPHSPLTFGDIDSTQADLTDGAYPRGPIGVAQFDQVHNIGEVWAGMLWEVRARFVTRLGHAVGNQRMLQYVTDGMKLDPTGPTMLQARDAIITAANAGGGTAADIADIWAGFATRGMGVLAQITNPGAGANTTRVVESFLTPSDPVPSFSINDVTAAEGNAVRHRQRHGAGTDARYHDRRHRHLAAGRRAGDDFWPSIAVPADPERRRGDRHHHQARCPIEQLLACVSRGYGFPARGPGRPEGDDHVGRGHRR
jgi:hypothetical protein